MPDDVTLQIEACVPDSDAWCAVLAHALIAMFGDGTCSADNVEASCFGAEWCDRDIGTASHSYVTDLMQNNMCYAALNRRSKRLMGFISLSNTSHTIHTIHTFCVLEHARNRGVGRKLMDYVIQRHGHVPLDLTVAAPTSSGPGATVLSRRHDRLVRLYMSYGFTLEDEANYKRNNCYTYMYRPAG